jgi:hypothetical protein
LILLKPDPVIPVGGPLQFGHASSWCAHFDAKKDYPITINEMALSRQIIARSRLMQIKDAPADAA